MNEDVGEGSAIGAEARTDDWVPLASLLKDALEDAIGILHVRLAERGFPDVRYAHGFVFRWSRPEGVRLTELAELAGHTKQAAGEFVSDLEASGYVERIPDPDDGRAKIIRLTERGAAAKAAARAIFAEIESEWAESVGEETVAALRESLEALRDFDRSLPAPA